MRKYVDTLIVIPNQNLFRIANERTTFSEAFVLADQVLYSGIACIVDLIVREGLINLDFADVRTVMNGMGTAMMGTGEASGERRAILAAEEAIANPLLDDVSLKGAKGLLISIVGGRSLTLYEVDEAATRVRKEVDPEANIIVGATFDESLSDRLRVSIVASGMERLSMHGGQRPPMQTGAPPNLGRAAAPTPPPPLPPAARGQRSSAAEHDDLARALSEAITRAAEPEQSGADQSRRRQWHSGDGVMFEEGARQAGVEAQASLSARNPAGYDHHQAAEEFMPGPPAETRRQSRRMPDVDDFPLIGQREYRAKMGIPEEPQPRPPRNYALAHEPAPRRVGFFERLTGARRRGSQDDGNELRSSPQAPEGASGIDRQAPPRERRPPPRGHPDGGNAIGDESIELPIFFNQEKRR